MKITVAQDGIELDSPEEALFYGLCRLWEIPVVRNIPALVGVEAPDSTLYVPGFYVPFPGWKTGLWVEIADGQHDAALRPGRAAFRADGGRLAVLYRDQLHVLMTRSNAHAVTEQLKIWAR